jgi:hypothetical protein
MPTFRPHEGRREYRTSLSLGRHTALDRRSSNPPPALAAFLIGAHLYPGVAAPNSEQGLKTNNAALP